ncbi:MAG: TRASH domain-containing protein, partial [Candidatus Nitrosotenuis sp.]
SVKLDNIRSKTLKHHVTKVSKDMLVKMTCDFCQGPVPHKPTAFKFGNFERFFCCTSCRTLYKEKYKGRIESLSKP